MLYLAGAYGSGVIRSIRYIYTRAHARRLSRHIEPASTQLAHPEFEFFD